MLPSTLRAGVPRARSVAQGKAGAVVCTSELRGFQGASWFGGRWRRGGCAGGRAPPAPQGAPHRSVAQGRAGAGVCTSKRGVPGFRGAHLGAVAGEHVGGLSQHLPRERALHRKVAQDEAVARVAAPRVEELPRRAALRAPGD